MSNEKVATMEKAPMNVYKGKLWKKVLEVGYKVGGLEKKGKNTDKKFKYISVEQITDRLRQVCNEVGLAILPQIENFFQAEVGKTKYGHKIFKTRVEMGFTLIDTETGYSEGPFRWWGEDQDTEKSFAQAITEATKRFHMKLFNISPPDEKDPDGKSCEAVKDEDPKNQSSTKKEEPKKDRPKRKFSEGQIKHWRSRAAKFKNNKEFWSAVDDMSKKHGKMEKWSDDDIQFLIDYVKELESKTSGSKTQGSQPGDATTLPSGNKYTGD